VRKFFISTDEKGPQKRYISNIILKINEKLGGIILGIQDEISRSTSVQLPYPECIRGGNNATWSGFIAFWE
jgi:hypothetical protein